MRAFSRVLAVVKNLFHKRQAKRHLDDEVRAYVDMVTDERIAAGAPAAEARRTTLAEAGGLER
jgi:hypothetical protein